MPEPKSEKIKIFGPQHSPDEEARRKAEEIRSRINLNPTRSNTSSEAPRVRLLGPAVTPPESKLASRIKIGERQEPSSEEESIDDQELPTTREIAQFTALEYKALLTHLSEKLRRIFESQKFKNCFLGISPEIGAQSGSEINTLSTQELSELKAQLAAYAPDVVIITHPEKRSGKDILSLMNLRAAAHIIRSNPDLFTPESLRDPQTWLINSTQEWWRSGSKINDITTTRYGVLSGYPRAACEAFPIYYDLRDKLQTNLASADELSFLAKSAALETKIPEVTARMAAIFAKIGPTLTPHDHQLLASQHAVHSEKLGVAYVGFDQRFDSSFIRQLESMHDSSGIDPNVTKSKIKILS